MDSFNSQNFINDLFWYTNAERFPAPLVTLFNRPNFKDFITDLNNQTKALKNPSSSPTVTGVNKPAHEVRASPPAKTPESSPVRPSSARQYSSLAPAAPSAASKNFTSDFYGGLETASVQLNSSSGSGSFTEMTLKEPQVKGTTSEHLSKQPPLPLYSTLLGELLTVSKLIDQCETSYRDYVWSVVFEVVGASHKSDKPFYPIILSWLDSPTVNLVAIELLYTSFSIALQQRPLPGSRTKLPRVLEEADNELPAAKKQKSFEEPLVPKVAQTPIKDISNITSFGVPTAKLVEEMKEHFRSLPEDLTPTRGSGLLPKAFGRSTSGNASPKLLSEGNVSANANYCQNQEVNKLLQSRVQRSVEQHSVPTKNMETFTPISLTDLPNSNSEALKAGLANYNFANITFVQLIDMVKHLQSVSVDLDTQPTSIQSLIWEACKISPAFQENSLELSTFQKLLQQWSSNLGVHKSNVIILYSVVEYFRNVGLIKSDDSFKQDEKSSSAPRSSPALGDSQHGPMKVQKTFGATESDMKNMPRRAKIMDVASLVCE